MEEISLSVISDSDPNFLGGISLFQKNLINYITKNYNYIKLNLIYRGKKDKSDVPNKGVTFTELKSPFKYPINEIIFNFKIPNFLKKNLSNIINSHAQCGLWESFYKKNSGQEIIHTYHGTTYHFYKNHLKRFGLIKKVFFSPLLVFSYLIEKPPWKKADRIICVSEHVKKELEDLYGKRENVFVIRTGVDMGLFKPREKSLAREKLNLDKDNIYGLYVGRGGYWTKGLDKVITLSKEIYNLNNNYRLIVIGADEKKVKDFIDEKFIINLPVQSRDKMPLYYNASNLFFSMSRYEGGAPTMVTSEAMTSGCLIITDAEAKQEIIENEKNGIFITGDYKTEAKRILDLFKNRKKIEEILRNSLETIKDLSLDKWGKRYVDVLLNKK